MVSAMSDIRCGKCGEPWNVYHVNHEFDDDEESEFLNGNGCPTCDWGEDAGDDDHEVGYTQERVNQVQDMMRNSDDDPTKYL